jgi:Ca2+-binding RTX toxin-like protein
MRKAVLLLASVALAMLVAGGVAWAATISCAGGYKTCYGTNQADTMKGNGGHNLMFGKGGGDTLRGYGAKDYLNGGTGADKLYAGSCRTNSVFGGPGADNLYGGIDPDRMYGGLGSDKLYGGPKSDALVTGPPADRGCHSELDSSEDVAYGGSGNDRFILTCARTGVDHLHGEDGNDYFTVNQRDAWWLGSPVTKEIVDCGPGPNDVVIYDEDVDVVMDNCETLHTAYPPIFD